MKNLINKMEEINSKLDSLAADVKLILNQIINLKKEEDETSR